MGIIVVHDGAEEHVVALAVGHVIGAAQGEGHAVDRAAAGLQDIVSGILIDGQATVDAAGETVYNFTAVSWFWVAAAAISFLLPLLNWNRKQ